MSVGRQVEDFQQVSKKRECVCILYVSFDQGKYVLYVYIRGLLLQYVLCFMFYVCCISCMYVLYCMYILYVRKYVFYCMDQGEVCMLGRIYLFRGRYGLGGCMYVLYIYIRGSIYQGKYVREEGSIVYIRRLYVLCFKLYVVCFMYVVCIVYIRGLYLCI